MIEHLFAIDRDARQESPVHSLDARSKLILALTVIIAVVAYPYSPSVYLLGLVIGGFYIVLWAFSGLPVRTFATRLLMTLPFGLFIIVFQIFFENPHYTTFTSIVTLPLGIHIYAESVEFASILAVKFLLCIAFVILLSSTTTLEAMLQGGRRLGLPSVMALSLGMMIRYLYVFAGMYDRVQASLATRNFHPFDTRLPWKYRIKTLGYTIGTMVLRSYEQGERTYTSMLCRGYGKDSYDFLPKKALPRGDLIVLGISLPFVCLATVFVYMISFP
jgi:cobalt/nickel transport system permease protein